MARRGPVLLILLVAVTIGTYLTRRFEIPILGLLLLIYYELFLQTQLLHHSTQQLREMQEQLQSQPPPVAESIERTPQASTEAPIPQALSEEADDNPGYHLADPEYIASPPPREE